MEPSEILRSFGPNSVSAAAVITVVVLFLKHLASERRADRMATEDMMRTMKEMAESCHDTADEMRTSFQRQLTELETREEQRRRDQVALYDRDRRELLDATDRHTRAIEGNGTILGRIETGLMGGRVHSRSGDPE